MIRRNYHIEYITIHFTELLGIDVTLPLNMAL